MVKVAVLLAALGLASLWAFKAHETRAAEHRLGAIASELAERPVRIECQGFWAALFDVNGRVGEVQFPDGVHPADHAYLTRGICQMLRHFRPSRIDCLTGRDWASLTFVEISNDPCGRRSLPLVEAALTLAHESMHLRGYRDEATTQCHALDALRLVAERLGASGTEGDAMARYALALQPGMPTEYQFSSCPDLVPPPV
jgi:hypothetical protein